MTPSAAMISALQASTNCSNLNLIPAGPGDVIPAAVPVIIFTDSTGSTVNYNFDDLCAQGLDVYVIQNGL